MPTVHLIGICGTGMAALAAMLKRRGFEVRGSDQHVYPPMSDFLESERIPVLDGFRADHITDDLDLVIIGNAVSRGNPELEEVLDRKIRYRSLPEVVREQFLWGAHSIVVAGTHGKTTTAALTAWLLASGGLDPSFLIGGVAANFGAGYRLGAGRNFVIEGDEYDSAFFDKTAKFLKYLPDITIVGNLEFDHADIYPDLDAIRLAFRRLVHLVPRRGLLLLGADSPDAVALAADAFCRVETFGLGPDADWQAEDVEAIPGGTRFQARHGDNAWGTFETGQIGAHNVRNALAAIAVGSALGLDSVSLAAAVREFAGVRRRLELRGTAAGVAVFDDFAHHPTAVKATLEGVRRAHPDRRIWAIFEPRSATSCRRIFQHDLAVAFTPADEVVIAGVYRSSLPEHERLMPEALAREISELGPHARYLPTVAEIIQTVVRERQEDDLVVVMSNGAFDDIHRRLLDVLERSEQL